MADLTLPRPRSLGRPYPEFPVELATLSLLLAFAAWLRWLRLDAYTGSFDEGIRSQQLLLMSAGYRPFRDIFSSQGPLLLDLLYPFYALFGQTLEAARARVAVFSIIGLVGAWLAARAIAGPLAGVAAIAALNAKVPGITGIGPMAKEGGGDGAQPEESAGGLARFRRVRSGPADPLR